MWRKSVASTLRRRQASEISSQEVGELLMFRDRQLAAMKGQLDEDVAILDSVEVAVMSAGVQFVVIGDVGDEHPAEGVFVEASVGGLEEASTAGEVDVHAKLDVGIFDSLCVADMAMSLLDGLRDDAHVLGEGNVGDEDVVVDLGEMVRPRYLAGWPAMGTGLSRDLASTRRTLEVGSLGQSNSYTQWGGMFKTWLY
jgi:hypothetical protein